MNSVYLWQNGKPTWRLACLKWVLKVWKSLWIWKGWKLQFSLLYCSCRCECVWLFCVRRRIRWVGKPTHRGSGQIGCLLFLLLFNYAALKHRGYLLITLTLQKEESTVPFIMQSANKSGTTKIVTLHNSQSQKKTCTANIIKSTCVFLFFSLESDD